MNDNEKLSAIASAQRNGLHALDGGMEVVGEPDKDGKVAVRCMCGVMLAVEYKQSAHLAPLSHVSDDVDRKTTQNLGRRRISVNDDKDGG